MSIALAPFVTFMKKQKCVMDWNEDDWCNFLWSFWDAATTYTQAALRCARLRRRGCMVGYDKVCGLQQTYFLLCETLSENVHYYEFGSDGWQHVFSLHG